MSVYAYQAIGSAITSGATGAIPIHANRGHIPSSDLANPSRAAIRNGKARKPTAHLERWSRFAFRQVLVRSPA